MLFRSVDGKSAPELSAASVQLTGLERSWAMLLPVSVHDDLTFTLPAVPATRCAVGVAGLPTGYYIKSVLYGRREVPAGGLEATAHTPLTIIVSATGAAQLQVNVHDAAGRPAAFSIVTLFPLDRFAATAQTGDADENGNLVFPAVRPGRYRAIAWETVGSARVLQSAGMRPFQTLLAKSEVVTLKRGSRSATQLTMVSAEEKLNALGAR